MSHANPIYRILKALINAKGDRIVGRGDIPKYGSQWLLESAIGILKKLDDRNNDITKVTQQYLDRNGQDLDPGTEADVLDIVMIVAHGAGSPTEFQQIVKHLESCV